MHVHILKIYDLMRPVCTSCYINVKQQQKMHVVYLVCLEGSFYLVEFLLRRGCSVLKSEMLVVVGIKVFEKIHVVLYTKEQYLKLP